MVIRALVESFSVIVKTDGSFAALINLPVSCSILWHVVTCWGTASIRCNATQSISSPLISTRVHQFFHWCASLFTIFKDEKVPTWLVPTHNQWTHYSNSISGEFLLWTCSGHTKVFAEHAQKQRRAWPVHSQSADSWLCVSQSGGGVWAQQ